ncbi:hypothetical protein CAPTEDRAFT_167896 [Capitella teleta]|uniref:WD repeat-containing and planar cell polarity effector protein fritz homolog n=1 Tax=Capitella teleta TaxID=283909 RepID=R7U559_CAPTE|nr:hypothetical protein CAPTEDRAFT_167896 [Capitella teleta]|eukprot:ELU01109.1 hypothetical protein CAPTEDRAFT_167896 [Capitella teleta]
MASLLMDIHIWSLNQTNIAIPDEDIAAFSYHDKQESSSVEHPYLEEKTAYTEGRNVTWVPRNKRPEKLKDGLKEVEELLANYKCITCRWILRGVLQMMLSNGTLIYAIVCMHSGDVDRFIIDKTLTGKLSGDNPCYVLWTDHYLVLCYPDLPKLDFVCLMKRPDLHRKFEKLAAYDPKFSSVDLPGPVGRKLNRRLTCSMHQDLVACWWPMSSEGAVPWSPMPDDTQRANLALFGFNGTYLERIAFIRTDCEPLNITFSCLQPNVILTLEQSAALGGDLNQMNIDSCVYEVASGRLSRISVTTVAIHSCAVCQDRSTAEDKVLIGCDDGSIVLYDELRKLTSAANTAFIPSTVKWHPSGTLVLTSSSRGNLQIFDLALNPLFVELVSENPRPSITLNLSSYFRLHGTVAHIEWSPPSVQPEARLAECNDSVFILFDKGPMLVLQCYLGIINQGNLSPLSLVHEYLHNGLQSNAVSLLCGLNWNLEGAVSHACLLALTNHLLRIPLNPQSEVLVERALGCFYAPPSVLDEGVILEYRDSVSRLARRFFHQLLRFTRFEKAYLLAVDIGSRDLFMDLHHVARDKGEQALAEVSLRKANQLNVDSRASGEESETSDVSSEISRDDSYSGSDEEYIEGIPPRPPRLLSPSKSLGKPLPPSPPQQDSPRSRAWGPQYADVSRVLLHDLEADLMAGTPDEFTDILPPPPSHADSPIAASQVKVIHFGLV